MSGYLRYFQFEVVASETGLCMLQFLQEVPQEGSTCKCCAKQLYITTKSIRAALIGQSAVGYCAGKLTEKSRVF